MQVILPDDQIKQIQILISSLITSEIEKQIHHRNIDNSYLKTKNKHVTTLEFQITCWMNGFAKGFHPLRSEKQFVSTNNPSTHGYFRKTRNIHIFVL